MKKIIVNIKPFVLNQKVGIYEDDKLIIEHGTTLHNLPYILQKLCKEEEIEEVYLHGGHFAKKTSDKLMEISKFDTNYINVILL